MEDEQALVPNFSGVVVAESGEHEEMLNAKDQALAHLYNHPDFYIYEQFVKESIDNARKLTGIDLTKYEDAELGKVVKLHNMAADMVESILLKVKEAASAKLDEQRRSRGNA